MWKFDIYNEHVDMDERLEYSESSKLWLSNKICCGKQLSGGRGAASAWTDSRKLLDHLGGTMFSSLDFDDMWKYDPTTNWWTWMVGTSGY